MKKPLAPLAAVAFAAMFGLCGPVRADETGIAAIHTWVKYGRKICFQDHYHDGSGTGATRSQAQRAAIKSWATFTSWEYGTVWGNYALAMRKGMACSGSPGNWSCSTQAIPCRAR